MAGIDFSKYRIILSDEDTRASSIMLDSWLQGSYSSDLHAVDGFIAGFYRGIWYARQGDRVDDGTRLENEQAAKSLTGSNPVPALSRDSIVQEIKELRADGNFWKNLKEIKRLYRVAIRIWLDDQNMGFTKIRIELSPDSRYPYGLSGYFTIYSDRGAINKRNHFLNKITINGYGILVKHEVRTDSTFSKPAADAFQKFIFELLRDTK